MKPRRLFVLFGGAILVALGFYGVRLIWRGFSTADQPSYLETVVARTARNMAIPRSTRLEANPWTGTADVLKEARESFLDRCAVCHGPDGSGQTQVGSNLFPVRVLIEMRFTLNIGYMPDPHRRLCVYISHGDWLQMSAMVWKSGKVWHKAKTIS